MKAATIGHGFDGQNLATEFQCRFVVNLNAVLVHSLMVAMSKAEK